MKKLLMITIFAVIGFTNVQAQEFSFGVKGGLNIAGLITSSNTEDNSARLGFHIGGLAEFRFSNDWVAVQTEAFYSAQGTKKDETLYGSAGDEYDIKLNYINVPLLAKFYIVRGFNLYTGPQLGFLTTAEVDDVEAKESFESIDVAWSLGGGYQFDNGLLLDARFAFGLQNVNSDDYTGYKREYSNLVFQLGVGYKL